MKEKCGQHSAQSAPGVATISLQPRQSGGSTHRAGTARRADERASEVHGRRSEPCNCAECGALAGPGPYPAATAFALHTARDGSRSPAGLRPRRVAPAPRARRAPLGRQAFLKREIASRLVERLADVRRTFPLALDLGCHGDEIAEALARSKTVGTLMRADLGFGFARTRQGPAVVADEEALPFAAGRFDLVLSAMDLHWVNDLPGTLIQIGRILKPDGLFLGAMLGGATLWQLREALGAAESEIEGGLSPRVSPFADLRDAAGLLQRAGFALPVADSETIEVEYDDALALMRELGAMGEGNLVAERRRGLARRATLAARGGDLCRALRPAVGPDRGELRGAVPARLGAARLQPKPLKPGSAARRLADALGGVEQSAGEKAERS